MSLPTDNWFTGPKLERLAVALLAIGANAPSIAREDAASAIREKYGGSHEEAEHVLNVLAWLNLVRIESDSIRRANAGNTVPRSLHADDYRPLGLSLIRAGLFKEQARLLLESGKVDPEGNPLCLHRIAVSVAPQLIGLISRWPEFQSRPRVVIPASRGKSLK